MNKDSKIYIAGHRGIAGSALLSYLQKKEYSNVIIKTHSELDLCDSKATADFFAEEKPEYVFFAAVLPCGIANSQYRADFIYKNTMMQANVIHNSYVNNVKKLLCYSSSYVYPKNVTSPITEDRLLTGELEYFCEPFAVAKINAMKMCESYNIQYGTNFLVALLINLYGNNGNFDLETARVMHALIRKMHLGKLLIEDNEEAVLKDLNMTSIADAREYLQRFGLTKKSVEIWGTGKSKREFLHSYDMADASHYLMQHINFSDLYNKDAKEIRNTHINMGTGISTTIRELAETVQKVVGYAGELFFNTEKPDSAIDRVSDCSKLKNLGWNPKITLENGISQMYNWYLTSNN